MASLNKWDARNRRNMATVQREIDKLFDELAREAALIASIVQQNVQERMFSFDDYPMTRQRVERLLQRLRTDISAIALNGIDVGWQLANDKNDELVRRVFGERAASLSPEQLRAYYNNNEDAREAFKTRRENGLNLSDRVWRYSDQFKAEIEMGIDIGLGEGLSADELSRRLRSYLREPQKLFHRVRDKHGNLQLSKNAKAYHPGRGVYRSSYKNARRLAATETNIAYRSADYERYQQLDFVVGIRIELSNNHTLNGVPFEDICDQLSAPLGSNATKGRGCYPKDFKFTGWHPLCRCTTFSILKTEEEIDEDTRRILAGEPIDGNSVNRVTEVPQRFNDWVADNKERAKGWSSMPYFIRQNPQYVQGFEVDTYTKAERKFTRAKRTNEAMQESLGIYLQSKYPELPNTEKAAIFHYTQGEGATFRQLNNQLRRGNLSEFNEAFSELLSKGLSKLETTTETVYRSVRLNKTNLLEYLSLANNTGTTIFKGFTSTSLDKNIALEIEKNRRLARGNETDVLLVIRGKSGHPIEGLSQFSGRFKGKPNQREVLFDSGCEFRFDRVEVENGSYIFYLTEI